MTYKYIVLPYSGKIWQNSEKRYLILAKFKFGDLELYLWRTLTRRNWEWRLIEVDSCIQGYHVFESTREELNCVQERANTEDPYAVAVIRRSVVGHVSRKMSAACALFLRQRGTIRHDQHSSAELELSRKIQSTASPRARACTYVHVQLLRTRHVYYERERAVTKSNLSSYSG